MLVELAAGRVHEGIPVSRPRARLMVARSSGRPSRLLRSASVTNSSISLPTWRVDAAHDGAGRLVRREAARRECERIEEGLDQADRSSATASKFGIEPVDRLGQHRMAEAIDRMCELGDDGRVRCRRRRLGRPEEEVDLRLDGACELLEHEMLILHLGAELRRLEQALAVPVQVIELRVRCGQRPQPGVSSHWLRKARSLGRRAIVSLVCSTSRLCSEWNIACTVVRPMFSLTRPSPAM